MSSESYIQQGVAIIIAALAVMVLLFIIPQQKYDPCGILLPAKNTLPATQASNVNVYRQLPLASQNLGYISVEMHANGKATKTEQQLAIVAKAKELAATVGANGVVFNLAYGPSPEGASLDSYYLMGYAIYASTPTDVDLNALFNAKQ